MYLLMTALVAGNAFALDPIVTSPTPWQPKFGDCGTRPPPCLGITEADGHIMPPDWFWRTYEALGGELNYFRVELTVEAGEADIYVGGWLLDEHLLSVEESGRDVAVFYVPAREETTVTGRQYSREEVILSLSISGVEKSPLGYEKSE